MRLHNPIRETNANYFPLLGGCVYNSTAKFPWISSKITVRRTRFVYFFCLFDSCGHNMLQSAVASIETSKHSGDDHLSISTGDINLSGTQNREKTTKPKKKLVRSRNFTDQSTRVLHELKELKVFSISNWLWCSSRLLQLTPRWKFSVRLKRLVREKDIE